jgi:hypothetical protein
MKEAIEEFYQNLNIENLPDAREKKSDIEHEKAPPQSDYDDIKTWVIVGLLLIIVLESSAIVVLSLTLVFR